MASRRNPPHEDDSWRTARPQNKNLRPVTDRPKAEAIELSRKGGLASQAVRRDKQAMKDLVEMMSTLPVTDGRVKARLRRMGIPEEEFTQKLLVADALIKAAQNGSPQAIDRYLELTGESGGRGGKKENNLLIALEIGLKDGELSVDEVPEVQQETESGDDVVGQTEV